MIEFVFVKSTYSSQTGECVEVAHNVPGTIAVRDSKAKRGPILRITPTAWLTFHTALRTSDAGESEAHRRPRP
ncbi:DUF397 domain-containing protein [Streptomyces sp. NPDC096310]|uniref:DUF397 domain-containing protein n=1 Tax=Streptomyces sp. NPDC096310 TaxID=3366082 RepID=UPI00380C5727